MFSKACEYALKAVIYIATQSIDNERIKIGDVAKHTDSPEAFTAKVLGSLVKRGIIQSQTGPNGGFYIEKEKMEKISVSEIVKAIDGDGLFTGCALGLHECSELYPCPLHHKFIKVRTELKAVLERTSIYELTIGFQKGETTLVRQISS